jgi:probable HAF family extracellular repeat protein
VAQGRLPQRLHRASLGQPAVTTAAPGAVPSSSSGYNFTFFNFPGKLVTLEPAGNPGATASQQLITGSYFANPPTDTEFAGFILESSSEDGVTTETFSTANYPGATQTEELGINDSGQVVGSYEDSKGIYHGFELSDGKYTAINVPFQGAVDTEAFAINDAGDIVGTWDTGDYNLAQGFELAGGVYTNIQFPGAVYTGPSSINSSGEIVGGYTTSPGLDYFGFSLSGGTYTPINVPGSISTFASGINDSGEVTGWYCTQAGGTKCEEDYSGDLGFVESNGVYSTVAVPGFADTFLVSISDSGVIVGWVQTQGAVEGLIAVPK